MAILYFLICFMLITLGALTRNSNYTTLFILPVGIIAVLFQKFVHRERIKDLGFRICTLRQVGKACLLPLVLVFPIFFLDFIFGFIQIKPLGELQNPFNKGQIGVELWALVIFILIIAFLSFIGAFISEELGFRGYLITRLRKFGDLKALIFSSLLFGIWHLPSSIILMGSGILRSTVYVINIFLLGMLMGHLFLESKSLIPPSIFHGVWNALEYTLFGSGNIQAVFFSDSRIIFDPEEGWVGMAVLLAFVFVLLRRTRKTLRFMDVPEL